MNEKIAIVGSGLAAISAARALIKRGVKPVILDAGWTIEPERSAIIEKMSLIEPESWEQIDVDLLTDNSTVFNRGIPKKLAFGSDYFYGRSTKDAPVIGEGMNLPPFSYAKGGFSVGWGAAILPPDECDLKDWPISNFELSKYFSEAIKDLPFSAYDDELSLNFPLYHENPKPLKMGKGNDAILGMLRSSGLCEKDQIVFGQSRLLVRAEDDHGQNGCKYCGYCMSGCVYGCIYKSNDEIDRMHDKGDIEYRSGLIVKSLKEMGGGVMVKYLDIAGNAKQELFSHVFLAAGAVNSTRIVLQSKRLFDHEVTLLSRAGFVAPMLSLKKLPFEWPNINTQPGIFLEFKADELDNHWIHTQLSTPNELVLESLRMVSKQNSLLQSIKKKIVEHVIIAFCNMHSNHSIGYKLRLSGKESSDTSELFFVRDESTLNLPIKKAARRLFQIGRRIGCYTILPLIRVNSGSYHVGCTMPMTARPERETETDLFGCPKDWSRVHVIDSSVFPSLPGTTIGLLAMANASRIASEVDI